MEKYSADFWSDLRHRIKVVAFDLNGTLFKMEPPKGVSEEEFRAGVRAYGEHIRKPEYSPLSLPGWWERLSAFDEVYNALRLLDAAGFIVVSCSNVPLSVQREMFANSWIASGSIWKFPVARYQCFKPNPSIYSCFVQHHGFNPSSIALVTANIDFGDIAGIEAVGGVGIGIRSPGHPSDALEFARLLTGETR